MVSFVSVGDYLINLDKVIWVDKVDHKIRVPGSTFELLEDDWQDFCQVCNDNGLVLN